MQTSKKSSFNPSLRLIITCLVIILGSLFYWFYKSYLTNPNNVFTGMILNNLNTRSYIVVDEQQNLNGSLLQETLVNSGSKNIVISKETSNISSSGYEIQTQSVGTPSTDYSTYQKINVGKSSQIYNKIIGVWGVSSPNGSQGQGGQLFKSTMLTPFLFASPSVSDTSQLMSFIEKNKIYTIKSSKTSTINGRQAISYKVDINMEQYAKLLNLYSAMIGYKNQVQNLQYTGNQVAGVEISVDTLSRQLIGLSYIGSSSVQIYEDYGVNTLVQLPAKTIPLQQLKDQLISLSKH